MATPFRSGIVGANTLHGTKKPCVVRVLISLTSTNVSYISSKPLESFRRGVAVKPTT